MLEQTITTKKGDETRKRGILLRDQSGGSIELTLWGLQVSDPGDAIYSMVQNAERPVLAVKCARVGDFNGKTLSTVSSTVLRLQPNIVEAQQLSAW